MEVVMISQAKVPSGGGLRDSQPRESRRRYRSIAAAMVSALFGKGAGLLVNAATVPLTVRYLGSEGYGLWVTISSSALIFSVLDIGIANTLTNFVSEAYAKNDKQKAAAYFATAFWLVLGVTALLAVAGFLLWPFIHWGALFNVQNPALARETSWAVAAALISFLCALPAGLASKVLGGYQELHISNLFTAGGSVGSILGVILVIHFHGGLPALVAVFAGSSAAANALCLVWICFFYKPWMKPWPSRVRGRLIGDILHSGGQFFIIQIAAFIVFNSDNLVISHWLSPAQITPYNVTWKLVLYFTVVPALAYSALWPAYSEAYAKGDLAWIRTAYARNRRATVAALVVGCLILLGAGRRIIGIWAGPAAIPTPTLVALMCLWMIIYAITTNQSCLMGATSHVKKQAVFSLIGSGINLALSIHWVKTMGVIGVLLGTLVSYVLFIVIPATLEVRGILSGKLTFKTAREGMASDPPIIGGVE
jgi:O-antigen/teichoic acid export membrane protein